MSSIELFFYRCALKFLKSDLWFSCCRLKFSTEIYLRLFITMPFLHRLTWQRRKGSMKPMQDVLLARAFFNLICGTWSHQTDGTGLLWGERLLRMVFATPCLWRPCPLHQLAKYWVTMNASSHTRPTFTADGFSGEASLRLGIVDFKSTWSFFSDLRPIWSNSELLVLSWQWRVCGGQ